MKVISTYHPRDPETRKKFRFCERITLKDYTARLVDACFCYALGQQIKKFRKWLKREWRKWRGIKSEVFEKPDSMWYIPDSASSSSSNLEDGAAGLTMASQCLGDGANLYLQSMKTLAIMFIVLTIVNLPIFVVYQSTTRFNEFSNFAKFFSYFTLGNLARPNLECGYSDLRKEIKPNCKKRAPEIKLECKEDEYISVMKDFGLLYKYDQATGRLSSGYTECQAIQNPLESKDSFKEFEPVDDEAREEDEEDNDQCKRRLEEEEDTDLEDEDTYQLENRGLHLENLEEGKEQL